MLPWHKTYSKQLEDYSSSEYIAVATDDPRNISLAITDDVHGMHYNKFSGLQL